MRSIIIGLGLVLSACSTCPKFVDYQNHTVDVEGIQATLPVGTTVPVQFGVGKVYVDPKNREASEKIQELDLMQNTICRTIKDMPDSPEKDKNRNDYVKTLIDILKTAAATRETEARLDVELENPKFFNIPDRKIVKVELKWLFKPLENQSERAANVLMGLTTVHNESLIASGAERTSKTCKEVPSCITTHAWNFAGNPAIVRGGNTPTELTWTAEIGNKVKVIRVWWEFYQQEADGGNVCTIDQAKPYPSDGMPFLKVVSKDAKDVAGSCYRIWNYSTFNVH